MARALELTGQRFGRWLVLERSSNTDSGSTTWWCRCDCGTMKVARSGDLRSGKSISCGCYNEEVSTTHHMTNTRIHQCWSNMKARCSNPNIPNYANYGARGIKVCGRWLDFINFYEDMKEGYNDMLEIERVDVNGNYELANCKWVTEKEQGNNKRTTRFYKVDGITDTLKNLCYTYKISFSCVRARVEKGMGIDEALKTPQRLPSFLN